MKHILKTWPQQYELLRKGWKTFELRKNDSDYETNHDLVLREFNPDTNDFTDRGKDEEIVTSISHILMGGSFELPKDMCIMSLRKIKVQKQEFDRGKGKCKKCETRFATTDYNGHGYFVCEKCDDRLNYEFDNEYR